MDLKDFYNNEDNQLENNEATAAMCLAILEVLIENKITTSERFLEILKSQVEKIKQQ